MRNNMKNKELISLKVSRRVKITAQDMVMFELISKFGFANVRQVHEYFGGAFASIKARMSLLAVNGYLTTNRVFYDKLALYTVTKKANVGDLGLITAINLRDCLHDEMVLDVFLKLRSQFIDYTSERMLRAERGVGIDKIGRIPDLIGHTDNGDIAIEVDRTDKGLDRLRKIIDSYIVNTSYNEVWFICKNNFIFNNLEKVSNGHSKFKLFMLDDVLADKELVYRYGEKHKHREGRDVDVGLNVQQQGIEKMGKMGKTETIGGYDLSRFFK